MKYKAIFKFTNNEVHTTPTFSAPNAEAAEMIAETYVLDRLGDIEDVDIVPQFK